MNQRFAFLESTKLETIWLDLKLKCASNGKKTDLQIQSYKDLEKLMMIVEFFKQRPGVPVFGLEATRFIDYLHSGSTITQY